MADDTELSLLKQVASAVGSLQTEVQGVRADLALVSNEISVLRDRMTLGEKRTDELEKRADGHSLRAAQPSSVDLETQSQLAKEVEARQSLAVQVETLAQKTDAQTLILNRLDAIAKNPTVKAFGLAVMMAFMQVIIQYLASKGIVLKLPQ